MINMPDMAYVSIFTDNDLTHTMEDHFEIKLIARLLDQMYVYNHQCSHQGMMMHHHQHLNFQNICIVYLPAHKQRV